MLSNSLESSELRTARIKRDAVYSLWFVFRDSLDLIHDLVAIVGRISCS
jgi:hypothetical protein